MPTALISSRLHSLLIVCIILLMGLFVSQPAISQTNDEEFNYSEHGQPSFVLDWLDRDYYPHPRWANTPLHLIQRRISNYTEGLQKAYLEDQESAVWLEVGAIEEANSDVLTAINSNLIYTRWRDQGYSQKYDYANAHEPAFLHTTDPASAFAYQTSNSIVLHWLKDERYIKLYYLNGIDPEGTIDTYRIMRKVNGGDFDEYAADITSTTFVDTDVDVGSIYTYKIESKKPLITQYLEYSSNIEVTFNVPSQRAFWIENLSHSWTPLATGTEDTLWWQIKYGSRDMTMHVVVGAYQPSDPSARNLTVWYKEPSAIAGDEATQSIALVGEQVDGSYWQYTADIDPQILYEQNCGFACKFTDDTTGSVNILNGDYYSTDVNNRLASRDYPTYRLDPRSNMAVDSWMVEVDYINILSTYANPSGRYDAMFGDSIEPNFYYANAYPDWVRDEYLQGRNGMELYKNEFINYFSTLRNNLQLLSPPMQLLANWWRAPGWESLQNYLDGALIEGFASTWNYVNDDQDPEEWLSIFSESGWYAQISNIIGILNYNTSTDIYLFSEASTGNVNSLWERAWTLASYLLVADGDRVHFGHRGVSYPIQRTGDALDREDDWGYFPEMQIDLGDAISSYGPFTLAESAYLKSTEVECTIPSNLPGYYDSGQHHKRYFEHGVVLLNAAYLSNLPGHCPGTSHPLYFTVGASDTFYYKLIFDDKHMLDGGRFWTERLEPGTQLPPLNDGDSIILLGGPYASPVLDKSVNTVIYQNQPNQIIRARATSWNGDPMWFEVDADTLGLGSQVVLSEGPGLYESESFVCYADTGTYHLPVYLRDEYGYALYDTLTVKVLESPELVARYVNKSTDVDGLEYDGMPYSEMVIDYDTDGDEDMLITRYYGGGPLLFTNVGHHQNGAPRYEQELDAFENSIQALDQQRGCAAADYDNNGYSDVFIAHDTYPMLLRNRGPGNVPIFINDGMQLTYLDENENEHYTLATSWAGSWSDVNKDGLVDLLVTRADGSGAGKLNGTHTHQPFVFLLNQSVPASTYFAIMPLMFGVNGTASVTASSVSWSDIDGDGWQDLFLPSLGTPSDTRLYRRTEQPVFVDEFTMRFPGIELGGVDAAIWADLNRDTYPDMIASARYDGAKRPRIFMNNPANPGNFVERTAWADTIGPTTDIRAVDFDLDGWPDLVAVADSNTTKPGIHLLRNTGQEGLAGGFPYMHDVTAQTGFAGDVERVSGLAAADFLNDGDIDLVLGREDENQKFYYSATAADSVLEEPASHWLGVKLKVNSGANNRSGIGTVVTVQAGDDIIRQDIDGGCGLGGQNSQSLRFGLSGYTGSMTVTTRWPGGYEQDTTLTTSDAILMIQDKTDPTVIEASLDRSVYYTPNRTLTWIVTWDTAYSYAPDLDRVLILVPGQGTLTYAPGGAHVTATSGRKSGGGYWHRFQIEQVPCAYGYYTYSVVSDTHAPQFTEHTTASELYRSTFCASGEGEPNVED